MITHLHVVDAADIWRFAQLEVIGVGKKADLVVLEKNLFEHPVTEIAATRVLMTLFEGQVVYRDEGV